MRACRLDWNVSAFCSAYPYAFETRIPTRQKSFKYGVVTEFFFFTVPLCNISVHLLFSRYISMMNGIVIEKCQAAKSKKVTIWLRNGNNLRRNSPNSLSALFRLCYGNQICQQPLPCHQPTCSWPNHCHLY